MERTRPPPPSQEEPEARPRPAAPAPLALLVEGVRGLVVVEKDVDVLARALARPPRGDETPRARADLLLSLLEDPELGKALGSDGRSVHTVAVEALLALGYPYALEIPPEALSQARATQGPQTWETPGAGLIAGGLAALVQLVLVVPFLVNVRAQGRLGLGLLLAVLGTVLLPPLLAALGGAKGLRGPRWVGVLLMVLVGLGWLGRFGEALLAPPPGVNGWDLASLLPAVLLLTSAWLLRGPEGEEEP